MHASSIKSAIKRQILPRGLRRPEKFIDSPLVVAGMFQTSNGIGRAAEGCYRALEKQGYSPLAVDLSEGFHQIDKESSVPLSTAPQSITGTAIVYANPPELERALMLMRLRRWHQWRLIGAWAWELPEIPPAWRRQCKYLSEVWAPSQFVESAFKPHLGIRVRTVPHYFDLPNRRPRVQTHEFTNDSPFKIICMADGRSSFHRKNLIGAIRIFQTAFRAYEPVQLTLKCRNLEQFHDYRDTLNTMMKQDRRIRRIDKNLDHRMLLDLIAESDVLLSPHRSEGFGIPLVEAMAMGTVCVATGWSGNMDYMSEENSVLLPYTLRPVDDPTGVYEQPHSTWAEADIEAAAIALRKLFESSDLRSRIAEVASHSIRDYVDSQLYENALSDRPTHASS